MLARRVVNVEDLLETIVKACKKRYGDDVRRVEEEAERVFDEALDEGYARGCGVVVRATKDVGKFEVVEEEED